MIGICLLRIKSLEVGVALQLQGILKSIVPCPPFGTELRSCGSRLACMRQIFIGTVSGVWNFGQ